MDRFIARANIAHFRDLLARETDPEQRRVIEGLLALEQKKLEIAEGRARTPVVALTADANQGIREACQEAGMDGFLTKPIDPAELDSVLQTIFQPAAIQAA